MAADDGKRRLKVIQPKEDEGEDRPPWHWSAIGAVAIFLVWLPLAYLAQLWVQARYEALGDATQAAAALQAMSPLRRMTFGAHVVLGPVISLALASAVGGMLIGRFGGAAGMKEATAAGLAVGVISSLIGAWQMLPAGSWDAWGLSSTVILVAAGAAARGGAWFGLRLRR